MTEISQVFLMFKVSINYNTIKPENIGCGGEANELMSIK